MGQIIDVSVYIWDRSLMSECLHMGQITGVRVFTDGTYH